MCALNSYASAPQELRVNWENFTRDYFLRRPSLVSVFLLIDASIPAKSIDLEYAKWLGQNQVVFFINLCNRLNKKIEHSNSRYMLFFQFWLKYTQLGLNTPTLHVESQFQISILLHCVYSNWTSNFSCSCGTSCIKDFRRHRKNRVFVRIGVLRLKVKTCHADTYDFDLHQMRQAEEEKEWRKETRRKFKWFSGVGTWLLQHSATMDYDQQCHQSRSRRDIIAYGSTAKLLA